MMRIAGKGKLKMAGGGEMGARVIWVNSSQLRNAELETIICISHRGQSSPLSSYHLPSGLGLRRHRGCSALHRRQQESDDDVVLLRTAMEMHLHWHHCPPQYMVILGRVVQLAKRQLPSDVSPLWNRKQKKRMEVLRIATIAKKK